MYIYISINKNKKRDDKENKNKFNSFYLLDLKGVNDITLILIPYKHR
jgi:hypothetical protein